MIATIITTLILTTIKNPYTGVLDKYQCIHQCKVTFNLRKGYFAKLLANLLLFLMEYKE